MGVYICENLPNFKVHFKCVQFVVCQLFLHKVGFLNTHRLRKINAREELSQAYRDGAHVGYFALPHPALHVLRLHEQHRG